MSELWIIVFIIAIAFRVFNKVTELKGKLPTQWDVGKLPPIIRDMNFPWEDEVEDRKIKLKPRNKMIPRHSDEDIGGGKSVSGDIDAPSRVVTGSRQQNVFTETNMFDTESIVNGLIFSELLQPPKCRRRGLPHRYMGK